MSCDPRFTKKEIKGLEMNATEGEHYTISIKLYGKDGRKRIHKELVLPPSVNLPDAEYIFECLVKQGTKQGDVLILKDKEK